MGLYAWIGLGCAVGMIAALTAPRLFSIDLLKAILMGIAGSVVGGWIGARMWGDSGINYLGWPGMATAVLAAAIMVGLHATPRRRRHQQVSEMPSSEERPRKRAA